jgi:tRNA (guanine37-N1)-methyltransferase
MRVDLITIFPGMVEAALDYSMVKRARDSGVVEINVLNLRDFATDRHRTTDDTPCGGGGGMIMKPEPIAAAVDSIRHDTGPTRVVLTDPQGVRFTQAMARELSREPHIAVICGHYEGVDERVRQLVVTDEVSIGDYVLTCGELPALVIVDAMTRLLPGFLGDEAAPDKDSFAESLLEYPHYTRPRTFRGVDVPDVLLGGHHAEIARWRRQQQLVRTRERRPDLWAQHELSAADVRLLAEADADQEQAGAETARDEGSI